MIRARFTRQNGHVQVEAIGHARTDVCCGASMVVMAAGLALRDLAKQFPREIEFVGVIDGNLTDKVDSTDVRRKATRRAR